MTVRPRRFAVLFLWFGLVACAHRKPSEQTSISQDPLVVFDERLGVDDVFAVRIVGEPDLSGQYRVGSDGTIDFPYVGRLEVLGLRFIDH